MSVEQAREGVIKFAASHTPAALSLRRHGATLAALAAWRDILAGLGGVGRDPARYDGAGYGNVSARVGPYPGPRGARAFLVTGTQTGGARCVTPADFCLVRRYDLGANAVESQGQARPSSESLTHGALYDLGPWIRVVFHVHCPALWRHPRLPRTRSDVDYGTPGMAREVGRLARTTALLDRRILAMGGHEDGVIGFGRTAAEAGGVLIDALAEARAREFAEVARLCRP